MRHPARPPDYEKTWNSVFAKPNFNDRMTKIVNTDLDPERYDHWDNLRFRTPPEGLSHEEWWLAINLRRSALFQAIPLKDTSGRQFRLCQWQSITEHLHQIDFGTGGIIQMPAPITKPEMKDRYLIRSLIEESITSSQLEGAVTTRQVAKEMIRTRRPPRDRSERMILNNYLTMQRITKMKEAPMTPERVFEIHKAICDNAIDEPSAVGRLRRADEHVRVEDMYGTVFHNPPEAGELARRLDEMCAFANAETPDRFIHPVLRAIALHFWLAFDHPFVDGNGRVARALFYWSILRNKYWLFEFISISRIILRAPTKYYRAFLYTETDANDLTYFINHQLKVIRHALEELHEYIRRETERMSELRLEIRAMDALNYRQRALIEHALAHPDALYTIEGHQVSHNVVYQTARSDLHDLAKRKLLEIHRVGRTYQFRPVRELEQHLRETN